MKKVVFLEGKFDFIYRKEFWYISAFLNSEKVNVEEKRSKIEAIVRDKLSKLTEADLAKLQYHGAEEIREKVIDMVQNITFKLEWVHYIDDFPYVDENTELQYDMLGYFLFDVEYYKDQPDKRELIKPIMIQQTPVVVMNELVKYSQAEDNDYILLDAESPMYLFVTSDRTKPVEIPWSKENILKHKRVIGYWTEIYSGSWPDYNESLYDRRVVQNLSNRLSELHFIRRNSGFIYMAPENFKLHFKRYMVEFVLAPLRR